VAIAVAIVGAGPAGFYTAEALLQGSDAVQIDIIERLPTPYGLVRAGVAPDHQSTKQVTRRFDQTVIAGRVQFYGNVEVGRDLSLDELRGLYDAVVLAIGAPRDRMLGIPGEHLPGVYGASAFVGWYNGHPDFRSLAPRLAADAVVIGNGNVALDVARVLAKTRAELATSDIPDYAMDAIDAAGVQSVTILGRRGPAEAKFALAELREMARLRSAAAVVDPADLPAGVSGRSQQGGGEPASKGAVGRTLSMFASFAAPRTPAPKRVLFRFFAAPAEITGTSCVTGLRVERTRVEAGRAIGTGAFETLRCGTVVSAIGYVTTPLPGAPYDAEAGCIRNVDGRVAPGLYATGWAKRGPVGVIATNKPDGACCAQQILADVAAGAASAAGRDGLEALLTDRHIRSVSFADWQRIDREEVARAADPAPRRKFTTRAEMLAVLKASERARVG
jgi:ferredoxin--NADP+ reductase